MEKINYTSPVAEVITFNINDIITTSLINDIYEGEIDHFGQP